MPRINHFEYMYDDPDKAAEFYGKVFGWSVNKWQAPDGQAQYWLVSTGSEPEVGIDGGFMKPAGEGPRVMNTITVDDIDSVVQTVTAAGGTVYQPKMAIPGVGYQAYFQDPGGIVFGVHQSDPSAR